VAFTAWGPVAQAGGAVVRFVDETGSVVVRDEHVEGALAAFSPDGQTLVSVSPVRLGSDAGPCEPTHVWVRVHDLTGPTSRRIARLRGGRPTNVRFSPTGRYVAVGTANDEGETRMHLFDLESGYRKWVATAVDVTWLDEAQVVLRERHGRLSLNRVEDAERVRVLAPPARRLIPYPEGADGTGFFATVGRRRDLRFARARLVGERLRIEERRFELPSRPVAISADAKRGALRVDDTVEIRDLESGAVLATVSGRPAYEAVALSADGRLLALVSGDAVEIVALDESAWISWGEADPPSELVVPMELDAESGSEADTASETDAD
jgi:dipeptidyl aminopeptidase/acylaminoacyl peptidase